MKKIKSLDYVLSFAMFILFIAGMSLMHNDIFGHILIKCSGLLLLTFIFYILAILYKKVLNVEYSSNVSYFLGCLSFVITYITTCSSEFFGKWFCITGTGSSLFLASIAILIAILSIMTIIIYRNYKLIHMVFLALYVSLYFLLTFYKIDTQIILLIISSSLLLFNLLPINKYLKAFTSVAIYLNSFLAMFLSYDGSYSLTLLILVLNALSILIVLSKHQEFEYELLSLLTIALLAFQYMIVTYDYANTSILLLIFITVLCLFDLLINTFRLFNNKFVKITYKIFNYIGLLVLITNTNINQIGQIIALAFIIISSLINAFVIHNEDYEEYVIPFKILFIAFLYETMLANLVTIILSTFIYLFIKGKEESRYANILFVIILVLMLSLIEMSSFVELLVLVIIGGIFAYLNRHKKFNYILTIGFLLIVMNEFVWSVFLSKVAGTIISSLMYFILMGISTEVLFTEKNHKNIFISVMLTLGLVYLLDYDNEFLICIYSLIVSLSIILIAIKNESYKALYYVGLIFGVLYLLILLSFLDGIPASIYLLVIAIAAIVIVSMMIYHSQNKKTIPDTKKIKIPAEPVKYCPNCGRKREKNDSYCADCGTKLN